MFAATISRLQLLPLTREISVSTGGRLSICLTGVLLKPADRSANEDFFVFRTSYNDMAIESCGVP